MDRVFFFFFFFNSCGFESVVDVNIIYVTGTGFCQIVFTCMHALLH